MALDFRRPVRRVMVSNMRAAPPITAFIPAVSIFGATVPADRTFPFIRCEVGIATPFRASGLDSSQMPVKVNAFTKALKQGDKVTDYAEDQAEKMAAAIAQWLDGRVLLLETGHKATITWLNSICTPDGAEKDAWHASVSLRVEVAG